MFAKCDMCMSPQVNLETPTNTRSSKRQSMTINKKAITLRKNEHDSKLLRKWNGKCCHHDDSSLVVREDPTNFKKGLRKMKKDKKYFGPEVCGVCMKKFPDV